MATSEAQHPSHHHYHAMDDRMDVDPPSPHRSGLLPHQQHAFQSACPNMRASGFYHPPPMPPSLSSPSHYDPVHSSIDDSPWHHDQWQAPPFNHSFSQQQRLPPLSNPLQSSYQGPAAFQPQTNQLPFGYQAAHPPAPHMTALLAPGPPFSGPPSNAPALFGRQRGGGGGVPGGGPGRRGSLGTQRHAQPTHGAPPFGAEGTVGHTHPQFSTLTDYNIIAPYNQAGLRPHPSAAQQGNSSINSFAATWQPPQWTGPQAYPYATAPLPPLAIPHPHAPRASHSSRRHRHSMPRNATATNGDLDDAVSPRSRPTSAFDDRLREAQAFRGSLVTKRVASARAIKSLKSVAISELPEEERMCNICYNEFGIETPEKVTETPVRLPGCKHVFGDRCIKTWFEDSNLCPYCREPVESEMRSFMPQGLQGLSTPGANQLRALLLQNPGLMQRIYDDPELVNDLILGRINPLDAGDDLVPPAGQPQERRAPPTNSEEGHRRQRPRHGSWVAAALQQQPPQLYPQRSRVGATDSAPRGTESGRRGSSQRRSATPPQLHRSGAAIGSNLSQMTTRSQAARHTTLPPVDSLPHVQQQDAAVQEPSVPGFHRPQTRNYADELGSESSLE